MRTRPFRALSALTALFALALASTAAAAPPLPFGHTCAPLDGALACPTASDAARVPSFDGVPLDVDVLLPPTGDGPFATIAMLHGFAGSKADPEAGGPASTTNAAFYARNGYAVLVPSARGFGRSCGVPASRTPDCARGWLHLADQRFEVRDVQYLLGLLVDEGVARADALASTGISYGGGQTLELALLRDRIVTPSGATAPWTSPAGRPLSLAAAWARWPWSDLADALLPNGRLGPATFASPIGVPIQAWLGLLSTAAVATGFVAPPGADPGAGPAPPPGLRFASKNRSAWAAICAASTGWFAARLWPRSPSWRATGARGSPARRRSYRRTDCPIGKRSSVKPAWIRSGVRCGAGTPSAEWKRCNSVCTARTSAP